MKKKLLFVHTGGTLGMVSRGNPGPLEPSAYAENVLPFVRGLEERVDIEGVVVCNRDSTDLDPEVWERVADTVARHIDSHDGFVVLHGTDTMAFTASALSWMLQDLPKPVVLTGAQRPIAELRTDARQNLIHASLCAALDLPEVGVFFGHALYRGNRSTKVSVRAYEAFASPSLPPLVDVGVDLGFPTPCRRPRGPFAFRTGFERDVSVIGLWPGIPADQLRRVVDAGARGVVLKAFGAGNVPLKGWPEAIAEASAAGVPVVVCSWCLEGGVDLGRYAGSEAAQAAGALSGFDLTLEAALTRLMFMLGQGLRGEALREGWARDLAGEIER